MKQTKNNEKKDFPLYLSSPGVHFMSKGAFLQKKVNRRALENVLKRNKLKRTKKKLLSLTFRLKESISPTGGIPTKKKVNRRALENVLKRNKIKKKKKK